MAEPVSEMPRRRNGREKYPWHQWCDGRAWKLVRGVDFEISAAVMQQTAWHIAKVRGLSVRTSRDGDTVYVEFSSRADKRAQRRLGGTP